MIQVLPEILVPEIISYVSKRPPPASLQNGTPAVRKPRVVMAHRLYRYAGDPRSERVDLETVEPLGYRVFVQAFNETVVVDCIISENVSSYRMHVGAIATSWLRQVRLLRKRKRLSSVPFELRWLLVQAHHLMFFWVTFLSGPKEADRFLQTREGSDARISPGFLTGRDVESLIQLAVSKYAEMEARRAALLATAGNRAAVGAPKT